MNHPGKREGRLMTAGALASISVAVILIAAKAVAYSKTASVSMLGSLADSGLDFLASAVNFVAIRASLVPADEEHRFGHGKAEAIAGLFQTSVIFASAAFLLWKSYGRFANPVPLEAETLGVGVSVLAIVLTIALVAFQKRVIRETESVAISADRLHYVGDVLLNVGVIAALILTTTFGIPAADGFFGAAIALYIGWNAWAIARESIDMLMDREFSGEEREKIFNIVMENPDVKGLHDLKTRRSGLMRFIQLHIELDPDLNLFEAHSIADEVEATIGEEFPHAEIIIHTDPLGLETHETFDELPGKI